VKYFVFDNFERNNKYLTLLLLPSAVNSREKLSQLKVPKMKDKNYLIKTEQYNLVLR